MNCIDDNKGIFSYVIANHAVIQQQKSLNLNLPMRLSKITNLTLHPPLAMPLSRNCNNYNSSCKFFFGRYVTTKDVLKQNLLTIEGRRDFNSMKLACKAMHWALQKRTTSASDELRMLRANTLKHGPHEEQSIFFIGST